MNMIHYLVSLNYKCVALGCTIIMLKVIVEEPVVKCALDILFLKHFCISTS
ncbi:hypothetical protein ACJX0J_017135, partial [Zea mays]